MRRAMRSVILAVGFAALGHAATGPALTQDGSCLVDTLNGQVQGSDRGSSCAFLGIPFAAPPVNALRWRPPQPAQPWSPIVLSATAPPSNCAQISAATGMPAGNEDCLRLNVWTPDPPPAAAAPVVVWLHTGSFVAASANFAAADGQHLAEQTGTIVVTPNYRLGPFGFLAHTALTSEDPDYPASGNYGLLDQRAALRWVRDNIARFGGDPNNVTIAGTSAGGHSVGLHLVSPGSAGLFQRAIMQSGFSSTRLQSLAEAEPQGDRFAAALGCVEPGLLAACMRAASRNAVLQALPLGTFEFNERPTHWLPAVDGFDVPAQPRALFEAGAFEHVPVLLGTTRDEGWTWVDRSFRAGLSAAQLAAALEAEFGADAGAILEQYPTTAPASPKDTLARLTGDAEYVCEARRLARLIERTGTPVFLYSFEYEVDAIVQDRVIHGLESNFVFANNFGPPLIASYVLNDADLRLARAMGGYWTRFAATGDPNTADETVVHWPAFKHPAGAGRGADKYLVLDVTIAQALRPRESPCDFWEPYFFRSVTGPVPAAQP